MTKPISFGKYSLLKRIRVGGMAEIFKAKASGSEGFERPIALKRILPSIAEDEEFVRMLFDEAQISAQLRHPNIAQILDLGKVGGSYFIAMEYVAGRDLRAIHEKMRKIKKAVPFPMAVYVAMKVCEGLDYAHNKKDATSHDLSLVHRDVSPQNILISYDGDVKVIDFGIAKATGKAGKTQAGILKGKFGYMSPEQVRGLPLDRRSDIFALGVCLWEMFTGYRLFIGESDFATLEKVRNVEVTPPSSFNLELPDELERITLKALQKDVEDRYQSAMDLHDDLQNWMYTSGSFFARKDLRGFMGQLFGEEMDRGNARLGGSRPAAGFRAKGRMPGAPSIPPPSPVAKVRAGTSIPPSSPPVAKGKRTEMGMFPPAAGPGVVSKSQPGNVPLNLVGGDVVRAAPPHLDTALTMDDWDDDEPATHIYTKKAVETMAQVVAANAANSENAMVPSAGSPGSAMAPATRSQNTAAHQAKGRGSNWLPILLVAAIVVVVFLVIWASGSNGNSTTGPNMAAPKTRLDGEVETAPIATAPVRKVEVSFMTEPAGATVSLIGKQETTTIGTTPLTRLVDTEQRYRVKYSKSGYVDAILGLDLASGNDRLVLPVVTLVGEGVHGGNRTGAPETASVETPLTPGMGTLTVHTRPWSKVYINGKFIKNTPLIEYQLKAGTYQVKVEDTANNVEKEFRVKIKAGQSRTLTKQLM